MPVPKMPRLLQNPEVPIVTYIQKHMLQTIFMPVINECRTICLFNDQRPVL